jgi:hypothetical protein
MTWAKIENDNTPKTQIGQKKAHKKNPISILCLQKHIVYLKNRMQLANTSEQANTSTKMPAS